MFKYLRRRSTPPTNLRDIIADVRTQWRVKLAIRGLARVAGVSLMVLLAAAYGLEWARFSSVSIITFRVLVAVVMLASVAWFLVRPLRQRVSDEQVALYLEEHEPTLEATLLSAVEASRVGGTESALVRRLVEQAVERCAAMDAGRLERQPVRRWAGAFAGVAVVTVAAVLLGPAFIRNAVSALLLISRDVEAAAPYRIVVTPGNASVPKGADESVTAKLLGFTSDEATIQARRSPTAAFETLPLVPNDAGDYEGIIFNVALPLEYFVEAAGVRSPTYTLTVVNLPYVQQIDLEYRFPAYTGLEPQTIEDGGDVAVLRGTEVRLRITPTMKTPGGRLAIDDKASVELVPQADGTLTAMFTARKNGFYRVELDAGEQRISASPQYTIDVLGDDAPTVSFRRPGRDTSASPIEEVFVEANAEDDFGVRHLELVYSVNGGAEKTIELFDGSKRLPEVTAGHTFYLEELGVEPGDSVSYYARATDNDAIGGANQTTSDLYFLRVRPFTKDFRQAQSQAGGGGGGGGGGGAQVEALSEQQRQIISATFNIQRDRKTLTRDKLREDTTVVSLSQSRLREQVEGLLTRMNSELVQRDPAFAKIGEMLPKAVEAMKEAEGKLTAASPEGALPPENKALQILQKAEEEYQIQVSVNQQQGGGGGGGGGAMQQELADIFEQELDKMASRYETASQASQEASDRQVDELLEKLKELARRQEQVAERQRQRAMAGQSSGGSTGAQQRALADQVEEAARRLEKLAREEQRQDLADSARQMQEAADQMRRAAAGGDANAQAQAQAALERLRDAEQELQRSRTQRAERDIQEARRQADEIAREQQQIAEGSQQLPDRVGARTQLHRQLAEQKAALEQNLADLEQQLDRAARDASKDEQAASRKLAEAADAMRDNRIQDKVRFTRSLANRGAPASMMTPAENDIARGIDEVRNTLAEASAALGQQAPDDRREQAVERAQRLARALESLRERTRQRAQDGQESGAEGQQASNAQDGQQSGEASQQGQGERGQGQQGQQGQGQQGQGQGQGQGQQASATPGQGRGQGQGQGQGQGEGGQGQQAGQGQGGQGQGGQGQPGQGQRAGLRAGQNGAALGNGNVLSGAEALNGGNAFDGRGWQLSPEDIRQLRGEARQYANDARDLRGLLRGEDIDAGQLDEILKALRQLQDERVYQDAAELQRLQTLVSEGVKRFEFNLRREMDEGSTPTLSGSDQVPEEFRALVEQYYRSLARTPR